MSFVMGHVFVLLTVVFTAYGQLVLKSRILRAGVLPPDLHEKIFFIFKLFLDPWVLTALGSAFLASLCWMAAMTRLPLSYAYPFTSLSFVIVLILSSILLNEPITLAKTLGLVFIILGIVIVSLEKI